MIDTNEYLADALKFLQTEAKEIEKEEELDKSKKEDDVEESFSNPTGLGEKLMSLWNKIENKSTEEKKNALHPLLSKFSFVTYEDLEDNNYHSLNTFITDLFGGYDKWIKTQKSVKEKENEKETEEEEVDERTELECATNQLKKESKKVVDDEQEDEDEEEEEEIKEIDEEGKLLPLRKNDKEGLVTVTASEEKKEDGEEIDEEADKRTRLEFWRDVWNKYKNDPHWVAMIKMYYNPEKDALEVVKNNLKEDTCIVDKLKNLLKTAKGSISVDDLKDILGATTIAKESVEKEDGEEKEEKEEEEEKIEESLKRIASLIV